MEQFPEGVGAVRGAAAAQLLQAVPMAPSSESKYLHVHGGGQVGKEGRGRERKMGETD